MKNYLDARHRGVFDANAIRVLVDAFDETWKVVQGNGRAMDGNAEAVREALAKHIVHAAVLGERDHRRLCDGALQRLADSPKV